MKKTKGFTMVELMVVTLIMGLLMSFSVAAIIGAKKASRDTKRKADLEQIRSALEMYKSDENFYPTDALGLPDLVNKGYMPEVPPDPSAYSYVYDQTSSNTYDLCAHLETGGTFDFCGGGNNCGGDCNYQVNNP